MNKLEEKLQEIKQCLIIRDNLKNRKQRNKHQDQMSNILAKPGILEAISLANNLLDLKKGDFDRRFEIIEKASIFARVINDLGISPEEAIERKDDIIELAKKYAKNWSFV